MSWWPWSKSPPPEKRQSQPYSDAIINAITQQAGGNISGDVLATAAVEMCAGSYARAFQGCTVKTDNTAVKKALTASVLGNIARSMIRSGESLHLIQVQGGDIILLPIGSWDVFSGGPDQRESWFVSLWTPIRRPRATVTHFVP